MIRREAYAVVIGKINGTNMNGLFSRHKIADHLPLLPIQPAREDGEQHLQGRGVNHGGSLHHSRELWRLTVCRPRVGTLRGDGRFVGPRLPQRDRSTKAAGQARIREPEWRTMHVVSRVTGHRPNDAWRYGPVFRSRILLLRPRPDLEDGAPHDRLRQGNLIGVPRERSRS